MAYYDNEEIQLKCIFEIQMINVVLMLFSMVWQIAVIDFLF